MFDLVIIGGGAAGLAAGLYAARYKLNVEIIAREFGGTGNIAHLVDNWIGDPGIGGFDLMQKFVAHVSAYNVPMVSDGVKIVEKHDKSFSVVLEDGSRHESKMVLFANGMQHRKLGVPGEAEYQGKGVHYCYTCDGPLYKNKVLGVVGGGDSAALGSLFLAEYATHVSVIVRREAMTAEPVSAERVAGNKKITIVPSSNVTAIAGDGKKVTSITLSSGSVMQLDGLFVEIGHLPLSDLAKNTGVALDARGYIEVDRAQRTNVPGVFAAGDITNATGLKQFITSAAEGSIAAQSAYNYRNDLHGGFR